MGQPEVLQLLLAKGANINAKGKDGNTALHWAINERHPDAAKVLEDHGAK